MKHQNLHTHTARCNHARGVEAEYAHAALKAGLGHLGFTDHVPFPDGRWQRERMAFEGLEDYRAAVLSAAKATLDLGLLVYLGLECEYDPAMEEYLRDLLQGPHGFDYLVCGVHYFRESGEWIGAFSGMDSPGRLGLYADTVVKAMASGLFSFVAHPDLFGMSCGVFGAEAGAASKAICSAASDLGVPLEINTSGFRRSMVIWPEGAGRPYPIPRFWEIAASTNVRCVVNADAHSPDEVAAHLAEGYAFAEALGLETLTPGELGLRPIFP